MGEELTGDGKGTEEDKEGIGIHPVWGPFQLFSRGCDYEQEGIPQPSLRRSSSLGP